MEKLTHIHCSKCKKLKKVSEFHKDKSKIDGYRYGGQKAEVHHNNYDDPADIIWLCSLHHKELHNYEKELINA